MMRKAVGAAAAVVLGAFFTHGAMAADAPKPAASPTDPTKVEEFVIDGAHTSVGFEVPHLVISTVQGNFKKFEGNFFISEKMTKEGAAAYKTNFTVDAESIDTGMAKRDEHLRSPDFFDAKKFASMKFVSTGIEVEGDKKFRLKGDLTIKDKTKPVVFDVAYKGMVMAQDKKRAAFKATAEIDRKDYGLTWSNVVEAGPVVGDTITIVLLIEGIRKSDM